MQNSDSVRQFRVEYDPRLVEEAVLLRMDDDPEEPKFRRVRDRIYELPEGEERERRFQKFHAECFERLQLGRPVTESLDEQPVLLQSIRRCGVLLARTTQDEGADMHGLRSAKPEDPLPYKVAMIRMKPARLSDASGTRSWLRHELMHIVDMLDPRFGYDPQLPSCEAGPAFTNLLRDRYRVLWDTWIDGRLSRRGWLPEGVREKRFEEFMTIFSAGGPDAEEEFQQIFDSDSQTHAGLMAFALHPGIQFPSARAGRTLPQPCPLCRFPNFHLLFGEAELPAETQAEIRADFPAWQPEHGLCRQCADLYQAREMSRAAEAVLPRIC